MKYSWCLHCRGLDGLISVSFCSGRQQQVRTSVGRVNFTPIYLCGEDINKCIISSAAQGSKVFILLVRMKVINFIWEMFHQWPPSRDLNSACTHDTVCLTDHRGRYKTWLSKQQSCRFWTSVPACRRSRTHVICFWS